MSFSYRYLLPSAHASITPVINLALSPEPMYSLAFISDLHLDHQDNQSIAYRAFRKIPGFCQEHEIRELYILGDLFDSWIGDEEMADYREVTDILLETGKTTQVFFMPGNHDFMIGDAWLKATGVELLPDPYILELAGHNIFLTHGDQYCVHDRSYLRLRAVLRHPWTLALARRLPLAWKLAAKDQLKSSSNHAKTGKSFSQMDVPIEVIKNLMVTHHCQKLIHGHTHRPCEHHINFLGAYGHAYVLPSWEEQPRVLYSTGATLNLRNEPI